MNSNAKRVLIVGSEGGVGRAFTSLLTGSTAGRHLKKQLEALYLVDASPSTQACPTGATRLKPTTIRSADDLGRLVRDHRITQVVDLSSVDTVDCTSVCDELGADFLSTSVEEWAGHTPLPTDEAIARLLPPRRPLLIRRSHLVGAGANPGIVNALVFRALEVFADKVGVSPTLEALDLHAVYITEEDTTVDRSAPADPQVFPMTWSPYHCLEELFEPRAFAARNGQAEHLGHGPAERFYKARCGDRLIEAMAVPHEETTTLSWRLPDVELAFLYRISEPALRALARHPGRAVDDWQTRKLYPPADLDLTGRDRLGVLLCSRKYGELWLGFDTDVSVGARYGTNATELQVATGVLAGLSQLGLRKGIHFVEDLDWSRYLSVTTQVLGEPLVVYDAKAPTRSLVDRAVQPGRLALTG